MIFNWVLSLFLVINSLKIGSGSVAETKLFTDLLKGYNPLERPVQNSSQPLVVKIKLFLQQILDVDEKNQIVSVNAWLSYTWFDHKLQWEPKKYGGIQDIRFPGSSDHIWKPDVLLYNSAAEDFDSTFKSNLLTYHTGTVVWIPPGVLKFVCQLDVTWFPFDDQVCEMKFGSWTFHGYAIDLQIDDDTNGTQSMDLSTYLVNGEWQVISTNAKRIVSFYKCCPEPYPTVNYYLHIRRRTLYYGFNLIIPSLLISLMAILGFMFPPDAGEKITLGKIPNSSMFLPNTCVFLCRGDNPVGNRFLLEYGLRNDAANIGSSAVNWSVSKFMDLGKEGVD
ncbi:hypothetical protein B9Z55_002509 [Caenorhabditis nigoni]|uniref:Neurotransmitter-gated ion-channel ligand-binding domain-containing protein n=1 Tax=Caenorhabditis nigoni TaxID=1611254 RepID=A0A2G5VL19_9PELO|nr:hypothetical protein B9Z55_002509 [Caenorhabditis nigoni]